MEELWERTAMEGWLERTTMEELWERTSREGLL